VKEITQKYKEVFLSVPVKDYENIGIKERED